MTSAGGGVRAYPYAPSIEQGRPLELCVEPGANFSVSIYRADTWELVVETEPFATPDEARPDPVWDRDWDWPRISIPLDLAPAVYFALVQEAGARLIEPGRHMETNAAMFVVTPARPVSPIAYIVPLATMHAYNFTGGGCFYEYREPHSPRRSTVTWRRPGCGIGGESREVPDPYDGASPRQAFAHWDAKMLAWLRRAQFAVDCYTDLDLDQNDILPGHRLMISAGHHEYWSNSMRNQVERFVRNGGNAAIFSGNTCYRRVSFDTTHATITRENEAWPDSNEASLVGVSYSKGGGCWARRPPNGYFVETPGHWVFECVELPPDRTFGAADRLLGYECDGVVPGMTPADTTVLATGQLTGGWNNGEGRSAAMVLFQLGRGTVFNASTTDWARVLHDANAESHATVARITENVVRRLSS